MNTEPLRRTPAPPGVVGELDATEPKGGDE